jgi:hypothetical protein
MRRAIHDITDALNWRIVTFTWIAAVAGTGALVVARAPGALVAGVYAALAATLGVGATRGQLDVASADDPFGIRAPRLWPPWPAFGALARAPLPWLLTALTSGVAFVAGSLAAYGDYVAGALAGVAAAVAIVVPLVISRLSQQQLIIELEAEDSRPFSEGTDELSELRALVDLRATYEKHEINVLNDLHLAFRDLELRDSRLIESTVLTPTAEVFAVMLAGRTEHPNPHVELGVAVQTDRGVTVTHSSGEFTADLKRGGELYIGSLRMEEVLARKAAAHFASGGWFAVDLAGLDGPHRLLFALTDVPFGQAEREFLLRQAAVLRFALAALARHGSLVEDAKQ